MIGIPDLYQLALEKKTEINKGMSSEGNGPGHEGGNRRSDSPAAKAKGKKAGRKEGRPHPNP